MTMEVTVHSALPVISGQETVSVNPDQTIQSVIHAFCDAKEIFDRNDLVLRNREQIILPNHRTLASLDVSNRDILYLGMDDTPKTWSCKCNQWLLLAVLMFLLGIAGLVAVSAAIGKNGVQPNGYGIVIDAGSSHSSLYIYSWPGDKENGTGVISKQSSSWTAKQSISSYQNNPTAAGSSLTGILNNATASLAVSEQRSSPIYLGATAGMRLVREADNASSEAILRSVRQTISSYDFNFSHPLTQARIIDGKEEGAFSWITVNYLLGVYPKLSNTVSSLLFGTPHTTYGALDLGGASTQITFVPENPQSVKSEYREDLLLYGTSYTVYTNSYLCYGLNEAYMQYLGELVKANNLTSNITDPCRPRGNMTTLHYKDIFELPCVVPRKPPVPQDTNYTFTGGSDPDACYNNIKRVFMTNLTCEECTFNGAWQPPLHGNFYAFSGYYYTMAFLKLAGTDFSYSDFKSRANELCKRNWKEVSNMTGDIRYMAQECFRAQYIDQLLNHIGFNDTNWGTLRFNTTIDGSELGWSMGLMLNASNVLPVEPIPKLISITAFILLFVLFVVFLLLGIFFCCFGRKAKSQDTYRRLADYGTMS